MIINGNEVAQNIKNKIKEYVVGLDRKPGLVVILVGNNPASEVYVGYKEKACDQVGFYSEKIILPSDVSQKELLSVIDKCNQNDLLDGILVQLPLPKHIDENIILETISPEKDVDGFHPINAGKLMHNKAHLRPCTPKGVMTLLAETNIDLVGKNCVVVGASNIVGRPMALELLNAKATVTICNSKTQDLIGKLQNADVVIVAVGIPKMIKAEWIKKGAIVIDVGINRLEDGRLVGDVDFDEVKNIASAITPVPGGVGPMTIATLLENTLEAYKDRQ
ncbi:Methylenetetrahydrofolate dehydrogenase (NADP+) / Methenyltetrahydrofolate cyclohydrolase [hydrothermal vent metagenome]|uniref:Methylenetetrahydrofolate dehydrogenase (NADP+) / Methenyltetrahydrofolate cyclohydrolase n=1 Tax=hydrothermal vent metagenome TaxID=652676 RepID=A0A1W1CU85_9ZZZZ